MTDISKILLIEDDTAIAGGLSRVLGRNGYEVTILTRGDEGLKQARARSFRCRTDRF
jgi:DNA-binding response OmpR family regulator